MPNTQAAHQRARRGARRIEGDRIDREAFCSTCVPEAFSFTKKMDHRRLRLRSKEREPLLSRLLSVAPSLQERNRQEACRGAEELQIGKLRRDGFADHQCAK